MLRVLGRPTSINVRKVLWLCAELGVEVDHAPWGDPGLPLSAPEFLALNPNGLVPVLVDDGFVLWESNPICRYLAARHGRTDLLPADPAGRARVEQWMDWQTTELNLSWRYAFLALVRKMPPVPDPVQLEASVATWNRRMAVLDGQLARTGAYVAGPEFTLADLVVGLSAHRWRMTPIAHADLPAVADWQERLRARPTYAAHVDNGIP